MVIIKQMAIKKYSIIMFRMLMPMPLKISFTNCNPLNGYFLPVSFSSNDSESNENKGESKIKIRYLEKVLDTNQKIILITHAIIKLKYPVRKGFAKDNHEPESGISFKLNLFFNSSAIILAKSANNQMLTPHIISHKTSG